MPGNLWTTPQLIRRKEKIFLYSKAMGFLSMIANKIPHYSEILSLWITNKLTHQSNSLPFLIQLKIKLLPIRLHSSAKE